MKTPNCNICEWFTTMNSLDEKHPRTAACAAQGYKYSSNCYNTKECKKLFTINHKLLEDKK
jgi:hypothetical protein